MERSKQKTKKYDCFISHASEDKTDFVEALVLSLESKGIAVWYDTHILNIGDSLRKSIDKGLKESICGVVILSKNFFEKQWTDYELNGLTAIQNSNGQKIILPIWHNITAEDVREYSPSLSDIVAGNSKSGVETVAISIIKAIKNIKNSNEQIAYSNNNLGKESSKIIESYEQNNTSTNSKQAKSVVENLIIDKKNIIKIHKFFNGQLSTLSNLLIDDYNKIVNVQPTNNIIYERTLIYDRYCENLLETIICAAYWGDNIYNKLWVNVFKNLANCRIMQQGYTTLINLQRYPSLLIYYSLLLVGLLKENFELIYLLFYGFDVDENNNEHVYPVSIYYPDNIIPKQVYNSMLQQEYKTPVSDHIHNILRPYFREYIISDTEYAILFDRVEYLISIEFAFNRLNFGFGLWFPVGRYVWRNDFYDDITYVRKNHPFHYFNQLADNKKIFEFGLLGKTKEQYNEQIKEFKKRLTKIYFL